MTISLVPVDLVRVDLSDVEDVERERLIICFEGGAELAFRIDLSGPWLVLDPTHRHKGGGCEGEKLLKKCVDRFYEDHVVRPWHKRLADLLLGRKALNSNWPYQRVWDEIRVEVAMGNEAQPSAIVLGYHLEVDYGTRYRAGGKFFLAELGAVVSTKSITLEPMSLAHKKVDV